MGTARPPLPNRTVLVGAVCILSVRTEVDHVRLQADSGAQPLSALLRGPLLVPASGHPRSTSTGNPKLSHLARAADCLRNHDESP